LHNKAGEPKPALDAYRFPFAVDTKRKGKPSVWGIAPQKGKVMIEKQVGSSWKEIGTAKAKAGRVFLKRMNVPRNGTVRARKGSEASLGWML
jgi:hypothetical protein